MQIVRRNRGQNTLHAAHSKWFPEEIAVLALGKDSQATGATLEL